MARINTQRHHNPSSRELGDNYETPRSVETALLSSLDRHQGNPNFQPTPDHQIIEGPIPGKRYDTTNLGNRTLVEGGWSTSTKRRGGLTRAGEIDQRSADTSWHDQFLKLYEAEPIISRALKALGVSRFVFKYHLNNNINDFAEKFEEVKEAATEELEYQARRRALAISDNLMMFILKGLRPEIYRENAKIIQINAQQNNEMKDARAEILREIIQNAQSNSDLHNLIGDVVEGSRYVSLNPGGAGDDLIERQVHSRETSLVDESADDRSSGGET